MSSTPTLALRSLKLSVPFIEKNIVIVSCHAPSFALKEQKGHHRSFVGYGTAAGPSPACPSGKSRAMPLPFPPASSPSPHRSPWPEPHTRRDRKSTRLNSSHANISY